MSSAQTIGQSQCVFVFFFSVVILGDPFSVRKLFLVLLCVAGVITMTYGDGAFHDGGTSGSGSSESAGSSADGRDPSETGSVRGDVLLILPSVCNAL